MILDDYQDSPRPEPPDREAEARALTEKCGYAAAALTLLPLPGSEIVGVVPVHVGMVVSIGHIYGVEVTRDSATQLLLRIGATVGLSLVGSRLAMTCAKLILPGVAGIVAAPLVYASTLALGAVARAHFERGGLSDGEMRSVYAGAEHEGRQSYDPAGARTPEARQAAGRATGNDDEAAKS